MLVLEARLSHLLRRQTVVAGLGLGLGGRGGYLARVMADRRLILLIKLLLACWADCGLVLGKIA